MTRSHVLAVALVAGMAVTAAPAASQVPTCQPMTDRMALDGRASPYDSTTISVDGGTAKICYGRPSARGRTMIGGDAVPYGKLWRTGANEPTTLHLPFAAEVAGIALEPGSYSLYTIPGLDQWVVILNESTGQWGHEAAYSAEVRAQEVGRGTVQSERLREHVETLTFHAATEDGDSFLVLEWENTRVRIPIRAP